MSSYPMFQEIINEMQARPEADPVGILEENVSPLLDVCNKINDWIATHPTWDFTQEPPWYEEFIYAVARFDIDLTPIWREAAEEAAHDGHTRSDFQSAGFSRRF